MHAKPDLRVVLKWMIYRSGSVIAAVIRLRELVPMRVRYSIRTLIIAVIVFSVILALGLTETTFRLDYDTDGWLSNPPLYKGDLVDVFAIGSDGQMHPVATQSIVVDHIQYDDMIDSLVIRVTQFQKLRLRSHDKLRWAYSLPD